MAIFDMFNTSKAKIFNHVYSVLRVAPVHFGFSGCVELVSAGLTVYFNIQKVTAPEIFCCKCCRFGFSRCFRKYDSGGIAVFLMYVPCFHSVPSVSAGDCVTGSFCCQ